MTRSRGCDAHRGYDVPVAARADRESLTVGVMEKRIAKGTTVIGGSRWQGSLDVDLRSKATGAGAAATIGAGG